MFSTSNRRQKMQEGEGDADTSAHNLHHHDSSSSTPAGEEHPDQYTSTDRGTLDEWLRIQPPKARPRLIDIRTQCEFDIKRLQKSICLPYAELSDLLFELPDQATPLALIGPKASLEEAKTFLNERGWQIAFSFVDDDHLWMEAQAMDCLGTGPVEPIDSVIQYNVNPFLESHIDLIEAKLREMRKMERQEADIIYTCCDVGCGSGRDAVWLAKRGHWRVLAMDRLSKCLKRVSRLSTRHGVEKVVECETAVIKGAAVVFSSMEAQGSFETRQYDLVIAIRFLEREFLPCLATMIRPGGFLLFVSFVEMEGIVYESPKDPNRLLQKGELSTLFGDLGFDVVVDDIECIPDGRFVSAFLARKPQ